MSTLRLGRSGTKLFSSVQRDVYDIAPFPVFQYPSASAHYVRVDVDRIYGVCHPDTIVVAEHVAYISTIAFRSVADEYLARFDKDSPAGIIVLMIASIRKGYPCSGPYPWNVSLLAISSTALCIASITAGASGLRNVTNTHSNDLILGMGNLEAVYLFAMSEKR